jgi:hypothetical protein
LKQANCNGNAKWTKKEIIYSGHTHAETYDLQFPYQNPLKLIDMSPQRAHRRRQATRGSVWWRPMADFSFFC